MRGYFDIMNYTEGLTELNGNGQQVCFEKSAVHTLWQPNSERPKPEPLYHLRVCVLKDQEGRGDCPSRSFAFKSNHHLTHAANQLVAAFGDDFDIKRCGVETPDAMGGRVNDGRTANVTVEFDSGSGKVNWKEFLGKLKVLEDEWEHEGMSLL